MFSIHTLNRNSEMIHVEIGEAVHSGKVHQLPCTFPHKNILWKFLNEATDSVPRSRREIRISEKATSSSAFTRFDCYVWTFLHVLLPHDLNWFLEVNIASDVERLFGKDWTGYSVFKTMAGLLFRLAKVTLQCLNSGGEVRTSKEFRVRRFVALATESG